MRNRRFTAAIAALAVLGFSAAASAGPLDGGFGKRGIVVGKYAGAESSRGDAVTVDSRRRAVVAGLADGTVGVAARRAGGRLDTSFAGAGSALFDVAPGRLQAVSDVEAQAGAGDDLIVAFDLDGGEEDFGVLRITADGAPVPSFGDGGVATFDLGPSASIADAAIDSGGRVWLAGDAESGSGDRDAFAMRLAADGTPDPAYGQGGVATIARPRDQRVSDSVLVIGRDMVLAGLDGWRAAVARLDGIGALEWVRRAPGRASTSPQLSVPSRDSILLATGGRVLRIAALDDQGRPRPELLGGGAGVRMPGRATPVGLEVGMRSLVVAGSLSSRRGERPFAVAVDMATGEPERFAAPRRAPVVTDMDRDHRRRVVLSGTLGDAYAVARSKPAP